MNGTEEKKKWSEYVSKLLPEYITMSLNMLLITRLLWIRQRSLLFPPCFSNNVPRPTAVSAAPSQSRNEQNKAFVINFKMRQANECVTISSKWHRTTDETIFFCWIASPNISGNGFICEVVCVCVRA